MKKIIRKIIVLIMALSVMLAILGACQNDDNEVTEVTLDSIKSALTEAGYAVTAELIYSERGPENFVGVFIFNFPGGHGNTPVMEFQDSASADAFAEYISAEGDWAIVNGSLVIAAHGGVPHADEAQFLENLINGRDIN